MGYEDDDIKLKQIHRGERKRRALPVRARARDLGCVSNSKLKSRLCHLFAGGCGGCQENPAESSALRKLVSLVA